MVDVSVMLMSGHPVELLFTRAFVPHAPLRAHVVADGGMTIARPRRRFDGHAALPIRAADRAGLQAAPADAMRFFEHAVQPLSVCSAWPRSSAPYVQLQLGDPVGARAQLKCLKRLVGRRCRPHDEARDSSSRLLVGARRRVALKVQSGQARGFPSESS